MHDALPIMLSSNMKNIIIKTYCTFICLLCSAGFSAFAQSSASPSSQAWVQDYAKKVASEAKKNNIPGVAIVVVQKGKPAFFSYYGVTERRGQKVNQDTLFRLASVSKTFTATLVAKHNFMQTLDWQTPLSKLMPSYTLDNYQDSPILLRHLIGQSAGFMPNAYDNLIEADYARPRVLNELGKLDSICKPGYCYTYQNALFGILEEYFQSKNSSYAQELQSHLFSPLKMKSSVGKEALEASSNWAKPHAAIARKKWRKVRVKDSYYQFAPAAGINASIKDMEIWLRAMLLEYPDVVNAQMVGQMTQARVETRNELRRKEWRKNLRSAHYGLGWRIYNYGGIELNYHGGWVQGYRADVAFSPTLNTGVAILMNAESNLINTISAQFWEAALANQ